MHVNHQRLPLLLTLVAGAAMLGVTAWQGYSFWQMESREPSPQTSRDAANSTRPEPRVPDVNLASLDLFGSASTGANAQPENTENLPETNLRLYLRGVLAATGELPGSALIEDDKSQTEAYLVGDELPGNATLRSVFPNRVILERGGKLENLYFPEDEDRAGLDVSANEPTPVPESPAEASPSPSPQTTVSEDQRREEIRQRLEQLRERLRNNRN